MLNNSEFLAKNKEPIQSPTKAVIEVERLSEKDNSSSEEYSVSDHQNESSKSTIAIFDIFRPKYCKNWK